MRNFSGCSIRCSSVLYWGRGTSDKDGEGFGKDCAEDGVVGSSDRL